MFSIMHPFEMAAGLRAIFSYPAVMVVVVVWI